MREPSIIKQDIENTQRQLEQLKQELSDATIVAYACIVTPERTLLVPLSPEIPNTCTLGTFTFNNGRDVVYFHESCMPLSNLYYDAAPFTIDGDPFTWERPHDGNCCLNSFPRECPCMVAVWRSHDAAVAWLALHKDDFVDQASPSWP
jgi:hypothetical protein